jgi:hypothetical protein
MALCTSCGSESHNLIEVFPGNNLGKKLPFCADCISLGAFELPFVSEIDLAPQHVLQSVIRVNRNTLNEFRAARADVSKLEARIHALEQALAAKSES